MEKKKDIEFSSLFKEAWELFGGSWKFLVVALGLLLAIEVCDSVLGVESSFYDSLIIQIILTLCFIALSVFVSVSAIRGVLQICRRKPAPLTLLSHGHEPSIVALKYFVASVAVSIAVIIGLILLVVPGIIIAIAVSQVLYLIVDKKMTITSAWKMSCAMTKGYRMDIFVIFVLVVLLNIAGALLLLVGLVITLPLTMLIFGLLYLRLNEHAQSAQ